MKRVLRDFSAIIKYHPRHNGLLEYTQDGPGNINIHMESLQAAAETGPAHREQGSVLITASSVWFVNGPAVR